MTRSFLKKIEELISGKDKNKTTIEDNFFNTVVFFALLISIVILSINAYINLEAKLQQIQSISTLILAFVYFASRLYKIRLKWLFIVLVVSMIGFLWTHKEGSQGSVNYIIITSLIVFITILPQKKYALLFSILFVGIAGLMLLENRFPELIRSYPSEEAKHIDVLITFIYTTVFTVLVYTKFQFNYEEEKNKTIGQRLEIEKQHNSIKESLCFAQNTQNLIFQNEEELRTVFDDVFILNQPKRIVTGDFFWVKEIGKKTVCVTADCQGKGVSGALLTILSLSVLKELSKTCTQLNASALISSFLEKVNNTLKTKNKRMPSVEAIELSVCIIDKEKKHMEYAGTRDAVLISKNNKLIELTPQKEHPENINSPCKNQVVELDGSETIYMYSNGYINQLGSAEYQKYGSKRFYEFISKIGDLSMKEKGEILKNEISRWSDSWEQSDDILVLGFNPKLEGNQIYSV